MRVESRGKTQATFFTRPEWMQSVQTKTRFTWPSKLPRTRCKFGFHDRLDLLLAWLTL
jgi:hypothetical protein